MSKREDVVVDCAATGGPRQRAEHTEPARARRGAAALRAGRRAREDVGGDRGILRGDAGAHPADREQGHPQAQAALAPHDPARL
eukprot:scaffold6554_cov175-Prasinococcus_capsulatus_cf.AAC.1